MANKKIIVTGGAGYIGSHTIVSLIDHGFTVVSIDNLSRSTSKTFQRLKQITGIDVLNHEVDLCNANETNACFQQHGDAVGIIHFAAFKSVEESTELPLLYYQNNLQSLLNVLHAARITGIENIVFSSSCSVYGNVSSLPVTENTPFAAPECAYAATKQMGEQIVYDFYRAFSANCMSLRYFNPVGAHESALLGEVPFGKPSNLIPIITQTAIGKIKKMFVWGNKYDTRDGTCIRDYIHVMDIAEAHTAAIQYLMNTEPKSIYENINLGSGIGVSVLEAIHAFEQVSGKTLAYEIAEKRPGDVVAVYANNTKAKEILKWNPKRTIFDMMKSAWLWQKHLELEG